MNDKNDNKGVIECEGCAHISICKSKPLRVNKTCPCLTCLIKSTCTVICEDRINFWWLSHPKPKKTKEE